LEVVVARDTEQVSDASLLEAAQQEIPDRHSLGWAGGHCYSPVFLDHQQGQAVFRRDVGRIARDEGGRAEMRERHLAAATQELYNPVRLRTHSEADYGCCDVDR